MTRGRPKKINETKLIAAIKSSYGNLMIVTKWLGCERHTVAKALKEYPKAQSLLEEERELLVDGAEYVVANAVRSGDLRTSIWLLERLGGKRGYNPALELKGNTSEPITLNFIDKEGANFGESQS